MIKIRGLNINLNVGFPKNTPNPKGTSIQKLSQSTIFDIGTYLRLYLSPLREKWG
jgi:hypothetical protein